MCGVFGRATVGHIVNVDELIQCNELLSHRGPDAEGIYQSECGQVFLAHKRLSIIDLSPTGAQPMNLSDDTLHIVFNGEIYNYKVLRSELIAKGITFKGSSDTEVLLNCFKIWRLDAFEKLNGAFACAIFDKVNAKIILARDRSGEKPLFYNIQSGQITFSSELTPILRCCKNLRLSSSGIYQYLGHGYTLGDNTVVDGVKSLPPASILEFDIKMGKSEISKFWEPKFSSTYKQHDITQNSYELEELIDNAVKLQSNADVKHCILLSGGIDSSLITAFSARNFANVATFTVIFPENQKYSEHTEAKLISDYFSTDHQEINAGEITPDIFSKVMQLLDIPINDSSILPTYMLFNAVSSHCQVALGGDGADELFGGYKHYQRLNTLSDLITPLNKIFNQDKCRSIQQLFRNDFRIRNWVMTWAHNPNLQTPDIREIFIPSEIRELLNSSCSNEELIDNYEWFNISSNKGSLLKNLMFADLRGYLSNGILAKSDRCSMMNSVESRAPFLDSNIINFCLQTISDNQKVNRNNRKLILQLLCGRLLPASFKSKRKYGFNIPFKEFLKKREWADYVYDILSTDAHILNKNIALRYLEEHLNGRNHSDKLFGLIVLLTWYNNKKNYLSL